MIGYRDRTFCIAQCATDECEIMLTDKVIADARKWWGNCSGDVPIIVSDYSDTCQFYYPKEDDNTTED